VTLGQLILDLPHRAAHGAEDFLVSGCSDRRFARTPSALVAAAQGTSDADHDEILIAELEEIRIDTKKALAGVDSN
jgi:hypothetical protein